MQGNIGVILTVHNRPDMARRALMGIERNVDAPFRLIVVDDASDDFTRDWLKNWLKNWRGDLANPAHVDPPMLIRMDENVGMAASINEGVSHLAPDDDILLIHSDTLICGPGLSRMREALHDDDINGVASSLSDDPNCNCVRMRNGMGAFRMAALVADVNHETVLDYFSPKSFFMLIKRAMWDDVGPLEGNWPLNYGSDSALWLNGVKKGWRSILCPWMWIHHSVAATNGKILRAEKGKISIHKLMASYRQYGAYRTQWLSGRIMEYINEKIQKRFLITSEGRDQVVFILREIIHLGGVHAVLNLVDEMILCGIDATVMTLNAMTSVEEDITHSHLFAPYKNINPETAYSSMARFIKHGVVVAGTMGCSYWARHFASLHSGISPMVFCQGDELRLRQDEWDKYKDELAEPQQKRIIEKKIRIAESYRQNIPCVAVSKMASDAFTKHSGGNIPVAVIPAAVDSLMFHPDSRKGRMSVLGFARNEPCHGGDIMMGLYEELRNRYGSDIRLVSIGDSTWGAHLGVEAYGRMNPDRVAEIVRTVTVLVDASRHQGFGLPCLEGMASGAVAVSFNNGGIDEYGVDGVNCLIAPVENEASLLAAVIQALEADNAGMITQGRTTAEAFSWAYVADSWMELLAGPNSAVAIGG